MVKCGNCGKSYDKSFEICPFCGKKRTANAKRPRRVLRVLAVLSIAVLMISVALNFLGWFTYVDAQEEGAAEAALPEQSAETGNDLLAELLRSGTDIEIVGAYPSDEKEYGEVLDSVRNGSGVLEVTLSSGSCRFTAGNWEFHDIEDVKAEIQRQTGWGDDRIHIRAVFSEYLKEGLILGQFQSDGKTPIPEGETDKEIWFEVVSKDSTQEAFDEETYLSHWQEQIPQEEYDAVLTSLESEEGGFNPEGSGVYASFYHAYCMNRDQSASRYPYIKAVEFDPEGADLISGQAEEEDGSWALTVTRATPEQIMMPNLIGVEEEQARKILAGQGVSAERIAVVADTRLPAKRGCVTTTTPIMGEALRDNERVYLFVCEKR